MTTLYYYQYKDGGIGVMVAIPDYDEEENLCYIADEFDFGEEMKAKGIDFETYPEDALDAVEDGEWSNWDLIFQTDFNPPVGEYWLYKRVIDD